MICINCVYHISFKNFVYTHGFQSSCDYCGRKNQCVEDKILKNFLIDKTKQILVPTDKLSEYDQAMIFEVGSDDPHVFELFEFFESHLSAIDASFAQRFIDSLPVDEDADGNPVLYTINDGNIEGLNDFERMWDRFNESIRHETRFFNSVAFNFCTSLFETVIQEGILLPILVEELEVTQPLYRARIIYSDQDIKNIEEDPISHLGTVPSELSSSQRMTPAGVSAFYAAFDRNTCISELRPIVGDKVLSGEFRLNRCLKLLDLNALSHVKNDFDVFSDNWRKLSHAYAFFPELVFKLTRPSSRNNQHDYLATQVIFEYLRTKFGSQIGGIIYPSIQKDGESPCLVLFPEFSSANSGYVGISTPDEALKINDPALFFVPDSVRFHRVKSASYVATEEDNSVYLTATDLTLKRLFPKERY